jgi:ribonuclease PH
MRHDGRAVNELRPLQITRGFTRSSPGSVLIEVGRTRVLCTASIEESVPPWLKGQGRGWITAEYNMLPHSTSPRKTRERSGKIDGRSTEIQRLIGRSLRSIIDLRALGERMITVDCDVIEADGGTRTTSINGALIALVDCLRSVPGLQAGPFPLSSTVAAVSVGIMNDRPLLDLDYQEDAAASVDMNIVMTGQRRFVEVQGSGEEATFSDEELGQLLQLARGGITQLIALQRQALGADWPWPTTSA